MCHFTTVPFAVLEAVRIARPWTLVHSTAALLLSAVSCFIRISVTSLCVLAAEAAKVMR